MATTNKKRVREIYFYKTQSGDYKIDLIDGRNNIVKEPLYYKNRSELINFIEALKDNKNTRFEVSALGMKIYNRKPDQRLLTKTSESVFDIYVENLKELKESSFYRHKVASLLRNVSDILDGDAPIEPDCDVKVMPADDPSYEVEVPAVIPEPVITPEVPMHLIMRIQDTLDIAIMMDDLTFWFQDQKFQLTRDGFEQDGPELMKPKASHNIAGTLEYIANLLGVNAERSTEMGNYFIRFVDEGNVYKINHIYTGDHNTFRREI